jgi:hypothetical protein
MIADWAPDAAVAVPPGDAARLAAAIEGMLEDDRRMGGGGLSPPRATGGVTRVIG